MSSRLYINASAGLHARLALPGGGIIYAGDTLADFPYEGIKGVSITLDYPSVTEAERRFAALAEGGQVTMPMGPVFWAKSCGMVVDQFGAAWIVNGELLPM